MTFELSHAQGSWPSHAELPAPQSAAPTRLRLVHVAAAISGRGVSIESSSRDFARLYEWARHRSRLPEFVAC